MRMHTVQHYAGSGLRESSLWVAADDRIRHCICIFGCTRPSLHPCPRLHGMCVLAA